MDDGAWSLSDRLNTQLQWTHTHAAGGAQSSECGPWVGWAILMSGLSLSLSRVRFATVLACETPKACELSSSWDMAFVPNVSHGHALRSGDLSSLSKPNLAMLPRSCAPQSTACRGGRFD
eukprot:4762367-Prymnesium_polylepis.2